MPSSLDPSPSRPPDAGVDGRPYALLLGANPALRRACVARVPAVLTCATGAQLAESGQPPLPGEVVLPVADFGSVEAVTTAVGRAGVPWSSIGAVLSAKEAGLVPAALLGAAAGARAPRLDVAVESRDKSLQKARVRRAGLPTAEVRQVATVAELRRTAAAAPAGWFPVLVKPAHGVASASTFAAASAAELHRRVGQLSEAGVADDVCFVVEERVDFDAEWHLDGVVREGRVEFLSAGRYLQPRLATAAGAAGAEHLLDRERHWESYALADPFAQEVLSALGVDAGVFHLEAFHRDRELIFGECAVRPGGNGICQVVAAKYDVDLVAAGVDAVLGRPRSQTPRSRPEAVGYTTLPSLPGVVTAAPTTSELLQRPGVRSGDVKAEPGREMPDMRRENRPFGGLAVLEAPDEELLVQRIDDLIGWYAKSTILGDRSLLAVGAELDCAFAVPR